MKLGIYHILFFIIVLSCDSFHDSPFSDRITSKARSLNNKNLQRIKDIEQDKVIRIAVFTDIHQNYDDFKKVVEEINSAAKIDFAINLGDFTNNGYNYEYDIFLKLYLQIKIPVLSVIGNHDSLGAGSEIFKKVFGSFNFWFESETVRYVFFNTAKLENEAVFDPLWLKRTVEESAKEVIIFSHFSPYDPRFVEKADLILKEVTESKKTLAFLNGHYHVFSLKKNTQGTILVEGPRVENRQWLLIEIIDRKIHVVQMAAGEETWLPFKE